MKLLTISAIFKNTTLAKVAEEIQSLIDEHGSNAEVFTNGGIHLRLVNEGKHYVLADHPVARRVDEYGLSENAAKGRAEILEQAGYENVTVGVQ